MEESVTGAKLTGKARDYISFADFCYSRLGTTCQMGSLYAVGLEESKIPDLGHGLRIIGDRKSIGHSWKIHKDDAEKFADRKERYDGFIMANSVRKNPKNYEHINDVEYDEKEFPNYIRFCDMVFKNLDMQTQYASRYVDGLCDTRRLADDLRIIGPSGFMKDEHYVWLIHKDDVDKFVKRVKKRREG